MKFKDFQAPVLFSSTFKALNLGEKKFNFQGCGEPCNIDHLATGIPLYIVVLQSTELALHIILLYTANCSDIIFFTFQIFFAVNFKI